MAEPTAAMSRTASPQRFLAPDLARGLMLLGIALANAVHIWVGNPEAELVTGYGGVYDNSILDKITVVLGAMFIHMRGLPMFSMLLGFGVGLIILSLERRGFPVGEAKQMIARRYGFLTLLGLLHMVFLFYGDIIFFYGLAAIVLGLMITLRDKTLLWIAGTLFSLQATFYTLLGVVIIIFAESGGLFSLPTGFGDPQTYAENLQLGLFSLGLGLLVFPFQLMTFLPLMLLGFVAARRGIHRNTGAHLRLLWIWVGVGVAVVLVIGLPWGLAEIGVLPTGLAAGLRLINLGLGLLTGPAIIASIALVCQPLQERLNHHSETGETPRLALPLRAVTALGKRSLTGYVLQSVFFLILLRPFWLGLGIGQGAFEVSLIALGVWLLTVLLALGLDYAGRPGPLEQLHRRLSYGREGLPDRWQPKQRGGALT
ncbi:hypothetical protein COCCU_08285 [Corynebacterium occultum]|uniref:DUF418 domain-containing protein n=1 Tax=Corynebacterium occultum TaxID=2675219 RepID=A0A6B8W4V4_9CORY|nr:DUF418 domain-containing protein [Corynebacterium occultum]QGU07581.1 hypothetical protein COCCU_08285 [Corynebacterium occultum]